MDAFDVTTIICPNCDAELAPSATTCERCGAATTQSAQRQSSDRPKPPLERPWVLVVFMLHVGLLGIPWYWRTSYSLGVRVLMVLASIVYTVGALVFIVLMLQWLIRIASGG